MPEYEYGHATSSAKSRRCTMETSFKSTPTEIRPQFMRMSSISVMSFSSRPTLERKTRSLVGIPNEATSCNPLARKQVSGQCPESLLPERGGCCLTRKRLWRRSYRIPVRSEPNLSLPFTVVVKRPPSSSTCPSENGPCSYRKSWTYLHSKKGDDIFLVT